MATLQVKRSADDLHAAASARAREQGLTLSEYVTQLIRRDVARPSWASVDELLDSMPKHDDIDAVAALDEARAEWD